jgi:hypothetical protein
MFFLSSSSSPFVLSLSPLAAASPIDRLALLDGRVVQDLCFKLNSRGEVWLWSARRAMATVALYFI